MAAKTVKRTINVFYTREEVTALNIVFNVFNIIVRGWIWIYTQFRLSCII